MIAKRQDAEMAHPFEKHKEVHAGRKRAHEMGHFKRGGGVHSDEAADRKLFGKMIKEHDQKVHGKKGRSKFARGGAAKDKKGGNHVNIAIVNPKSGDKGAGGPAMPPMGGAGLPPRPPAGAMPPPGAVMPPPGMKPPGVMKRGGKVKMTAGSDSGVGRLQKARAAR